MTTRHINDRKLTQWNDGYTALVHPTTGADVLIGGDSVLSVSIIKLLDTAPVNTGATIPFDTAVRNDLGLTFAAGVINFPAGMTQFRFGYQVKLNGASSGVASAGTATAATRRITTSIATGGVAEDEAALGILDANIQYPGIGAGDQALVWATANDNNGAVLVYQSPWIDIADLTTAPTGTPGDDTLSISLTHNAGAGAVSVLAGSSMWLETMTPNT